jgi:predicted permease
METLIQDVRYALRTLAKTPGFVVVTVSTLALGIGANLAIFALVNSVLLQPLPFSEPERLVRIFDDLNGAGDKDVGMSVPEFEDLRERSGIFEQISAIWPVSTALSGGERAERIEMLGTSPGYFEMLGAKAALGRVYQQSDWVPGFLDGVVISDALWKRQFGSDPNIIGRRIRIDEDGYTIIGVMPPQFRHPGKTLDGEVEVWAAAGFVAPPAPVPPVRSLRFFPGAMARLRSGLSIDQAQQQLNAFVAQLRKTYPGDYPEPSHWSLRIEPVQTSLTGDVRPTLMLLLIAVGFVLLIVCVNVATLLIARSLTRMREFAIRQALGASRRRLIRQVLTECVVISSAGAMAALLFLRLARTSLIALMPPDIPRLNNVHADWRIAAFAILLSVICGIFFGLAPAFNATTIDPNRDLKEGGRTDDRHNTRQGRSRAALVTFEIALAIVLLMGAGLLIRSFSAMLHEEPGIDSNNLTVGQIWIPVPNNPDANHYLNPPQRATLARELLRRMGELEGPQNVAVGLTTAVPFLGNIRNAVAFYFPDDAAASQESHVAALAAVSPNYFDLLRIPLKKGRVFTEFDNDAAPRVLIVNETFARKYFPGKDPVGQRMRDLAGRTATTSEIVGVVGDVRDQGLDQPPEPRVYASIFQRSNYSLAVFLRSSSNLPKVRQNLMQVVREIDPELPVYGVRTMEELISSSMARRRFALYLMSIFALLALLLASLGIYGLMTFLVNQRVREFGIRMALGAQARDVLMLALRPALLLLLTGTAVGLIASIFVTRLMSSLLFGVSSSDPLTLLVVPTVLGIVTLAACLIPARQAARISPAQALRC